MANKTQNLKAAYNDLKAGHIINCNGCKIYIEYSEHAKRQYIFWQNRGRGTERMGIQNLGIQNLRWIFRMFARSKDYSYKQVS